MHLNFNLTLRLCKISGERNGKPSSASSRAVDECDSFAVSLPSTASDSQDIASSNGVDQDDWYEEITPPVTTGQINPEWLTELSALGGETISDDPQNLGSHQKLVSEITIMVAPPPVKYSSAVDIRLEVGVEMGAECDLLMLEFQQASTIAKQLAFKNIAKSKTSRQPKHKTPFQSKNDARPHQFLLLESFQKLFKQLGKRNFDIDSMLQLWLRLNASVLGCGLKSELLIPLDKESIEHLLEFLATKPVRHTRTWTLALTVFSLLIDSWKNSSRDLTGIGLDSLLMNVNFTSFLSNVLSGRNLVSNVPGVVHTAGPSLTQALHKFLSCILVNLNQGGNEHVMHMWHRLAIRLVVKSISDR